METNLKIIKSKILLTMYYSLCNQFREARDANEQKEIRILAIMLKYAFGELPVEDARTALVNTNISKDYYRITNKLRMAQKEKHILKKMLESIQDKMKIVISFIGDIEEVQRNRTKPKPNETRH